MANPFWKKKLLVGVFQAGEIPGDGLGQVDQTVVGLDLEDGFFPRKDSHGTEFYYSGEILAVEGAEADGIEAVVDNPVSFPKVYGGSHLATD